MLLIRIVRTYFSTILDYLKPGTPASMIDCNKFDERQWLDFRAIFVRCYRNFTAENRDKQREVVAKYKKSLLSCCYMKTTKSKANVYLVGLSKDELTILEEESWQPKQNNPFRPNSLGVGMYNWWGPKETKTALNSPVKETQSVRISLSFVLLVFILK